MKWIKKCGALFGVAALCIATIGQAAPAQASSSYTGAEEICVVGGGCGSGGGVFERSGRYYMMTVAHITNPAPLGAHVYAYHPAFRYVGTLAYKSQSKDIALIDMGQARPDPSLRIAANAYMTPPGYLMPSVADISTVPSGPDWAYYNTLCTTGWSASAGDIKTKCGWADNTVGGWDGCATYWCGIRAYNGAIAASVDAGASGSIVWQPQADGRVRLIGLMSNCAGAAPCSAAYFKPVYLFSSHSWSAAETAPGYSTGSGGSVVTGP